MRRFLYDHANKSPVSFHMPGHKGSAIFRKYGYGKFLDNFMDMDVTEIPGADNLFDANGIIEDVQRRYADLYGVRRSWLSVGGTSASLIASIMAVLDEGAKKAAPKLIIARNCHKAVYNGLALAGGEPVYAYPEIIDGYGISGEVTADEIERCIRQAPDAAGVVVTSPNYYGICSDIAKIADAVHRAGMVLIVDQAHGAHLKFFHKYGCDRICIHNNRKGSEKTPKTNIIVLPPAAEDQGADIVCNSTHKTLASMTQSAILNLCSDRVDPGSIEEKLQMIESSSPSYVLMTSLDINAEMIERHGQELFENWHSDIEWFYGNTVAEMELTGLPSVTRRLLFDLTKINIDLGISGRELEKKLNERGIFPELYAGNMLMCMTGIGNVRSDYEKLLTALRQITESDELADLTREKYSVVKVPRAGEMKGVPARKEKVPLDDAEGRVCAASITPYPPGSPVVCPGEEITREVIGYLKILIDEDLKIIGIDCNQNILVGEE